MNTFSDNTYVTHLTSQQLDSDYSDYTHIIIKKRNIQQAAYEVYTGAVENGLHVNHRVMAQITSETAAH